LVSTSIVLFTTNFRTPLIEHDNVLDHDQMTSRNVEGIRAFFIIKRILFGLVV